MSEALSQLTVGDLIAFKEKRRPNSAKVVHAPRISAESCMQCMALTHNSMQASR